MPITIQHSIAQEQLEAVEATYTQQLQPKLNHPHIAPHMRRSLRFIHRQGHSKATGFRSIWAKIRRKRLPPRTFTSQVGTWSLLCDLSSNTKRRFEGIRSLLRSKNQHHGHIWTVPYGRQYVQCPHASRTKSFESGLTEETPAEPKTQQTHLCATADASRLHHKFEDFPQTSHQQAQGLHHPILHTLHAAGVYKTPNHERHHTQLEGGTPSMAPRPARSMHTRTVPGEIPGQPTRWTHRHRTQQGGPRHAVFGVLGEIQCASRPQNIDVAAPHSHTEVAPQQWPTGPEGRRYGDDHFHPTAAHNKFSWQLVLLNDLVFLYLTCQPLYRRSYLFRPATAESFTSYLFRPPLQRACTSLCEPT